MTTPSRPGPRSGTDLESRDLAAYGFAKLRDQVFDAVQALWRRRKEEGWTQKQVAEIIGRDPAWVSRNLRAPGNWTLRTAGELIQGLGGEAEITVAALEDPLERRPNYDAYDGYFSFPASASLPRIVSVIPSVRPAQFTLGHRDAFQARIGNFQ